uniref:Probable deoxycytidylate deaminase n=1 Tax=Strigamia maritima TaxID=126957 RepID=T1J3X7_STRMM
MDTVYSRETTLLLTNLVVCDKDDKHSNQHKRSNYLSWEDYFMANALLSSNRSKDPNTQVGACIVNKDLKIVGIGYNGMPKGCDDDDLPWGKNPANPLADKHLYVCHAEMNAIMNKNSSDVENCTLYVTLFPCNQCAKIIIQSGIKEVVYMSEKCVDRPEYKASRLMLTMANINLRQFVPQTEKITINLKP